MSEQFDSRFAEVGQLEFPTFGGVRVMMMPFRLDSPRETVPIAEWADAVATLCEMASVKQGVAYLTIDEAMVRIGETHRRPGLHVDGVGPDGRAGGWGGASHAPNYGMLVAASHVGCRAWAKTFLGKPGPNGDCSALAEQCGENSAVILRAGTVYQCGPLTVHEAIPMQEDTHRQFVRVSMPSNAPWYEGYTENPMGVMPTGPIHPRRAEFMAFRGAQ